MSKTPKTDAIKKQLLDKYAARLVAKEVAMTLPVKEPLTPMPLVTPEDVAAVVREKGLTFDDQGEVTQAWCRAVADALNQRGQKFVDRKDFKDANLGRFPEPTIIRLEYKGGEWEGYISIPFPSVGTSELPGWAGYDKNPSVHRLLRSFWQKWQEYLKTQQQEKTDAQE